MLKPSQKLTLFLPHGKKIKSLNLFMQRMLLHIGIVFL